MKKRWEGEQGWVRGWRIERVGRIGWVVGRKWWFEVGEWVDEKGGKKGKSEKRDGKSEEGRMVSRRVRW